MQNSREQVRRTLSHQEPDRVIVDLGSTTSTGISAIAYHNLITLLGWDTGYRLHQTDPDVLQGIESCRS